MMINRAKLRQSFENIRSLTEALCDPLEIEDYVVQPIEDVSPPKWHLAHTTWFFEKVILEKFEANYKPYDPTYHFLFNSYYQSFGERWQRTMRGVLSRPTVREVLAFRKAINERMTNLIETCSDQDLPEIGRLITIGVNHEQQHQELLVTDIKYIFANNPLSPVYNSIIKEQNVHLPEPAMIQISGGVMCIGYDGNDFAWDNEKPVHRVFVDDFHISNSLVTCGEYLEFIRDGGYKDFRHWLSDGWDRVQQEGWQAPLYWSALGDEWQMMTLSGLRPIEAAEPVSHISYFEADAFARWAGKRLPTEAEWEVAAHNLNSDLQSANLLDTQAFHPLANKTSFLGNVWVWTSSSYSPYPGFVPEAGELAEYNGKFMSGQIVLRGGSCATPRDHIRLTYRNFFQPEKRWQFSGIRLADNLHK